MTDPITQALDLLMRKLDRENEPIIRKAALSGDIEAKSIVRQWNREDGAKRVPLFLPDGRDVGSVSQIASLMGESKMTAAHYVLETEGLPEHVVLEAKGLTAGEDYTDFVMVSLEFTPEDQKRLAQPGGLPPEELHVTLGYYGDSRERDDEALLRRITRNLAESIGPFEVQLNGLTRFSGDESDPIVVNVDSPIIENLRAMLQQQGPKIESEHGFSPHMTLGYIKPEEDTPFRRWEPLTVTIETIALHYGPKVYAYTFGDGVRSS